MINQLMALLSRSILSLNLLLFNMLTRRQVARMVWPATRSCRAQRR